MPTLATRAVLIRWTSAGSSTTSGTLFRSTAKSAKERSACTCIRSRSSSSAPSTLGRHRFDDHGALIDVGLSYELGRWHLGEGSGAPVLTVEPIAGARLLYDPVDVDLTRVGISESIDSFSNYVPDIGIRAFVDLTEHWNFEVEGDYGGFGVDDNHETWQAVGLIGYRWPACGVGWNFQVGYRAMRVFDLRKGIADIQIDVRGPDVILGVEF
jgi:hypothetical protein